MKNPIYFKIVQAYPRKIQIILMIFFSISIVSENQFSPISNNFI